MFFFSVETPRPVTHHSRGNQNRGRTLAELGSWVREPLKIIIPDARRVGTLHDTPLPGNGMPAPITRMPTHTVRMSHRATQVSPPCHSINFIPYPYTPTLEVGRGGGGGGVEIRQGKDKDGLPTAQHAKHAERSACRLLQQEGNCIHRAGSG